MSLYQETQKLENKLTVINTYLIENAGDISKARKTTLHARRLNIYQELNNLENT